MDWLKRSRGTPSFLFSRRRFYNVSAGLMHSVVAGNGQASDWPFRVTELEHKIIMLDPRPHSSLLLLGRSGTGKVRDTI